MGKDGAEKGKALRAPSLDQSSIKFLGVPELTVLSVTR